MAGAHAQGCQDQGDPLVGDTVEELATGAAGLVNLRLGDARGVVPGSLAEAYETLANLQQQGLIRHLGVSNATPDQVAEAQSIAPIVCVQNMYNMANRTDGAALQLTAADLAEL